MRRDMRRLELDASSRVIDLGCGPCGPLTFMLAATRCAGTGVDASAAALRTGHARAASLGVDSLLALRVADLDTPLELAEGSFDAAMALDVVLHLRDRARFFREVATLLRPGGRFLVTDAGVVTGSISDEEVRRRSRYGHTELVAPGRNETLLEAAGFRVIEIEDRTASVMKNASGRLMAMSAHRSELERISSTADLDAEQRYLETVVDLSRRGVLSRLMYLADCSDWSQTRV
jgi:SAM-dependent methyltransferase